MPPPSPVWAWDYKEKPPGKIYRDATFKMGVKIEGAGYESKTVTLKVKRPEAKK